jgi:uncharacterized protein YbaR (Trm112 family)
LRDNKKEVYMNNYYCPKCNHDLVENNKIVLIGKNKKGKESPFYFHTEVGNYRVEYAPDFIIKKGELTLFFCPHCKENLQATELTRNLIMIRMKDVFSKDYDVFFSSIAGEKCTYVVREHEVESQGTKPCSELYKKILYRKYGLAMTGLMPR